MLNIKDATEFFTLVLGLRAYVGSWVESWKFKYFQLMIENHPTYQAYQKVLGLFNKQLMPSKD
jgi:hypothetical protein